MRVVQKLILTASLASLSLALGSCNKTTDYELQNIRSVSAQIFGLGLKSADDSQLASYVFSIDNSGSEGLITNLVPLPYGTTLKDVNLSISVEEGMSVSIEGEGLSTTVWKADTKLTLPTNTELKLTVVSGANKAYTYSYKLVVKQYTYEPETISWDKTTLTNAPIFTTGETYTFVEPTSQTRYLVERNSASIYRISKTEQPTLLSFTGLPQGAKIKRVVSDATSVYALSDAGQLYELEGTNWKALDNGSGVYDLLGILPAYGAITTPQLALLVTPSRATSLDANLAKGKQAQFAVYKQGQLQISQRFAPEGFPGLRDSDRSCGINKVASYEGQSLKLSASTASSTQGQSLRSTWFTSDGLAWAKEREEVLEVAQPTSFGIVYVKDTYYRLEVGSEGLSVYYSTDFVSWTKSKDVALSSLTQSDLKQANVATWAEDGMIYLLQGQGAYVWRGELLKEKINK